MKNIKNIFKIVLLLALSFISSFSFGKTLPTEFYTNVIKELSYHKNSNYHIRECPCLPGFVRKKAQMQLSLRGLLDTKVQDYVHLYSKEPVALFFGSGRLLNELTVVLSMMSLGISPRIILVDIEYPKNYSQSIDIFKKIIAKFSLVYNVHPQIEVYTQMKDAMISLDNRSLEIDMYFMIDFYFDPNRCMEKFKDFLKDYNINNNPMFFILAKTLSQGPVKWKKRDCGSSLHIYQTSFENGLIDKSELVFSESRK